MKAPNLLEPKQRNTFRDKYPAVILAVAALLFCSTLSAQSDSTKYSQINGYGFKYKRHVQDSVSIIPLSTSPHTPYRPGGIRYRASDSTIQVWTGNQWNSIVTGVGNGVDTAYMVNDTVLVIETPDQNFMLQVGKRHVDTLYRKAGQDSIFYRIAGVERAILDSAGIPPDSTLFSTNYRRDTAVANLRDEIGDKLNASDTANKWVQDVYVRDDSLYKLKNAVETFQGIVSPTKIYYYPEDYEGVGDSSTDCTNAVRAAIAAMGPHGGILQFSQGNYVLTDSIIIPSNVTVAGVGGNANTNEIVMTLGVNNFYKGSSTNILFRGNSLNCFVAGADAGSPTHQHHGINFRDFNLRYQGTTPTAGAGILIVDGGNYTMENITVTGFYDCVYQKVACYEVVRNCVFGDFARFGFACTNEYVADWMDIALSDCFFYTGNTYLRPRACFYSSSPGGIKLMNCKTNLGVYDSLYLARYSIELTDSTGWSQDVLISNMSLESFYKSAIKMNFKASPNRQRLIGLTNIQTYTIFDAVEPAIDISYGSPSAGTSGQVMLENILAYNAGEVANVNPAVRLTNVQNPFVGKISARFYAKPYFCISCSNEKYTYALDRYYLDSNRTTLWSPGEMNICSDSSRVSGGKSFIKFLQGGSGLAAQAMIIDSLRRVVMYNSATTNPNAWLYVRKDTNTFVAADIINNSTGASAWSMLRLTAAGNSSAELFVPGSGSSGYGIIGSRNLGLFNSGFDIALMADGANIKFGNSGVETARFTGGRFQIGTTATQWRRLYVSGSIGAHKDSIPIITSIGSRYLLAQDTTIGDDLGRFKRILPSSLGFMNTNFSNASGALGVANGGTGNTSLTAYALLAGGTTGTGALQQVSGTGTSGQVLTSAGAGALPTWQTLSLNGSTTHDFGTIANNSSATTTVSVTGAADGDFVLVTKPIANGWSNGESYTAWVSAADQVTVRQNNNSGGSAGFGSQTINVKVIKQ